MSLIDLIVGRNSLRKQRDATIDAVEDQFDPSIVQPQVDFARDRAVEGIGEVGDIARSQFLEQSFVDEDRAVFGGNQARAIAGGQAGTRSRAGALSQLESDLATQDVAARKEGEAMLAQSKTKQREIRGQRESQIDQTQAMFEGEMSRRRMGLLSTVLGTAGALATTPFGGAGTSLAERGLTNLFGDGEDTDEVDMSGFADISNMFVNEDGVLEDAEQEDVSFQRPQIDISRDLEARDITQFGDFSPAEDEVNLAVQETPQNIEPEVDVGIPEMLARRDTVEEETVDLDQQPTINPGSNDVYGLMDAVQAGTLNIEDIENSRLAEAVKQRLRLRQFGKGLFDLFNREQDPNKAVERLESRGIGF